MVNPRAAPQRASEATAVLPLPGFESVALPPQARRFPEFRYMGSKHRLLEWLHSILRTLDFDTAADPFSGSAAVGYLLKSMGKQVAAADFLNFPSTIASGLIANSTVRLSQHDVTALIRENPNRPDFIERTFDGIFFSRPELRFLDDFWGNLRSVAEPSTRNLALTALIRSCMKRQPRGVFTVANGTDGSSRYDDGRRDVRLTLREHFVEQAALVNSLVFDNGRENTAARADAFAGVDGADAPDLVYLDPPYVPRADDNCYVKRYHFLEGLSYYWEGAQILEDTKVKKIEKPYTPFSYRRQAVEAFDTLFRRYSESTIVLSYSDNGYPDRDVLLNLLRRYKPAVKVHERKHRYHFGTHRGVSRSETVEYVLVGTDR